MKYIELNTGDFIIKIAIEKIINLIKQHYGLLDRVVRNGEVGYYADEGFHNSDYKFYKENDKLKYLKLLNSLAYLEEFLDKED